MDCKITDNTSQDFPPMKGDEYNLSFKNTKKSNSQNNNLIFPNNIDLDWAQIIYALNHERILFLSNYKTWLNIYNDNGFEYIDYTPEELCQRFLQNILPNIYEYELTEDELQLLNLLDLHPHFTRTSRGFTVKQAERLSFPANEAAIEAFRTQATAPNEIIFFAENVNKNKQILLTDYGEQDFVNTKFNLNVENATLLSVALCSDEDIPNCEILNKEELHKRLRAAKTQFENNGNELENIFLDNLLKKMNTLSKLKVAVASLIDKRLSNNFEK